MKKVVRKVWISMLTGLAFLVACTGPGKLTRAEKKQLKSERTEIVTQLQAFQKDGRFEMENHLLDMGPSIVFDEDKYEQIKRLYKDRKEELALLKRLVTIDQVLKNDKAAKGSQQQMDSVQDRIDTLQDAILNAEPPKLYGPPPVDPSNRQSRLDSIRNARSGEIKAPLYGPPPPSPFDRPNNKELDEKIGQLQSELDSISAIIQRREGACVYGSPEVMERYRQETNRLRTEADNILKEILRLQHERKTGNP